jgi:hypothetical protein
MALSTPSLLDTTTSNVLLASITSGSISPTANALLVVCVTSYQSNKNSANFFTGCSDTLTGTGTWTLEEELESHVNDSMLVGIYTAQAGSSPGSGTITVTWDDNSNRNIINVYEITGFDTTTPVEQSASNGGTGTTLTVTLGASPDSANMVFGTVTNSEAASGSIDHGSGFTELGETDMGEGSGNIIAQQQYDYQSADTTCDWSSVGTVETTGVAIEIVEESVAGGDSLASTSGNLRKRRFQHLLNR